MGSEVFLYFTPGQPGMSADNNGLWLGYLTLTPGIQVELGTCVRAKSLCSL